MDKVIKRVDEGHADAVGRWVLVENRIWAESQIFTCYHGRARSRTRFQKSCLRTEQVGCGRKSGEEDKG